MNISWNYSMHLGGLSCGVYKIHDTYRVCALSHNKKIKSKTI